MKTCRYCNKEYPETYFGVALTTKNKVYRRHKCRFCYTGTKKQLRKRYREWILDFKKGKKCVKCGITDHRVLDFHHSVQEDKNFAIAEIFKNGRGMDSIKREINKCIVVCANCHRIIHYEIQKKKRVQVYLGYRLVLVDFTP